MKHVLYEKIINAHIFFIVSRETSKILGEFHMKHLKGYFQLKNLMRLHIFCDNL